MEPRFLSIREHYDPGWTTQFDISVFNDGAFELVALTPEVVNPDNGFSISFEPEQLPDVPINETAMFTVHIEASGPLRRLIAIRIASSSGSSFASLDLQLLPKLPSLSVTPSRLDLTAIRGRQYNRQFQISNNGLGPAVGMEVLLPSGSEGLLYVSSATHLDNSTLPADGSMNVTLTVAIPVDHDFVTLSGRFVVFSTEDEVNVPFSITIRSSQMMNVTIRVEDEFTYFAEGQPRVEGAEVTVTGPGLYAKNTNSYN